MAKFNKIKMELTRKANFIIFLVLQAITLVSYSQPLQKIAASEQYANSMVIMIPENRLNVDLTGKNTKVHLYVVTIDSGQLTSIVNKNKFITGPENLRQKYMCVVMQPCRVLTEQINKWPEMKQLNQKIDLKIGADNFSPIAI